MLYPPILASTQSVFVPSLSSGYEVKFSLASITSSSEIGHIGILVAKQSNNKSVVDTDKYPDGIIYKPWSGENSVVINNNDLSSSWEAGSLYKIQLRFGSGNLPWSDFATWHREQVDNNAFSEWSTVMIVKPISAPVLEIVKDAGIYFGATTQTLVASLTPTFLGICTIDATNKEVEELYKFNLYQGNTLLESSDWLSHISGQEDVVYFKTLLENQHTYQVSYTIRTNNGYETTLGPSSFIAVQSTWRDLENIEISAIEDTENARILIKLEATDEQLITGNFVITRSSEKSDFKLWEDIKYLNYFTEVFSPARTCFIDYTIESGVTYQYAIQGLNLKQIRTNALYTGKVMINLEYSYLVRDGVQLRLTFNQKMSSFKHSTLRFKQDTLGDKYPHLFQNGKAYYAEFPVTGLISYQGNGVDPLFAGQWSYGTWFKPKSQDQGVEIKDVTDPYKDISVQDLLPPFFVPKADGIYCKDELVISKDKFEQIDGSQVDIYWDYQISTNLTNDNIYIERKFREKVEEFLNDFGCKLYRSPTEGNIAINLMNVTMTPIESLGRMLYEFSATAYEILEPSLVELDKYGIIDIDEYNAQIETGIVNYNFGQVEYWPGMEDKSIYNKIKQQEEVDISEILYYSLDSITSFWIEPYPKEKIMAKIMDITATEGKDKIPDELKSFLEASESLPIRISVNGQSIFISPYKVYTLVDIPITQLELVSSAQPILINYTSELTVKTRTDVQTLVSREMPTSFGQVAGLFSEDEAVLYQYNFNWDTEETLKIAGSGLYSIYRSKDIVEVIKENTKQELEKEYHITLITQLDGSWKDESTGSEYRFNGIDSISIEADKGTIIYIGQDENHYVTYEIGKNRDMDGEIGKPIRFESNRIFFKQVLGHSNYLRFENTSFAIIDYTYLLEIIRMDSIER